jgi:hypothetical protein
MRVQEIDHARVAEVALDYSHPMSFVIEIKVGWTTGLEPATTGITIRDSTS